LPIINPSQKKRNANKTQKKKYDEPAKLKFVKGTGNADKNDNELRNKMNLDKKVYKNTKGLDNAAKDNEKIKPTKNYLEKDIEKQYKDDNEEVAKPQFTSNKEDGENFVELNKNEDVRNILFIIILIYIFDIYVYSCWQKIWLIKIMKIKTNIQRKKRVRLRRNHIIKRGNSHQKKIENLL
jgi:hypothetical protein